MSLLTLEENIKDFKQRFFQQKFAQNLALKKKIIIKPLCKCHRKDARRKVRRLQGREEHSSCDLG